MQNYERVTREGSKFDNATKGMIFEAKKAHFIVWFSAQHYMHVERNEINQARRKNQQENSVKCVL